MERKSLVPLVREVCPIVKKARLSVKTQKRLSEENIHKSIFEAGALKRANEISGKLRTQPAVIGEEFDR